MEDVPLTTQVKQRMIEQMAMLLATRGLQSASFAEVLDAAGARSGSVYHHLPGGKAEGLAASLIAASEGAVALSRAEGSLRPFELMCDCRGTHLCPPPERQ